MDGKECKLEIHPDKTRIIYCRSDKFNSRHEHESFDFLGYTFRRRYVKSKYGNFFNAFTPSVSKQASQKFREKIRNIKKETKTLSIETLAEVVNPIIRGWANYFSQYSASEARKVLDYINLTLIRWVKRKYKRIGKSNRKAFKFIANIAKTKRTLFYHWQIGIVPTIG
ncbi:group II intron maturase-specific domain-containing protein [Clostridium sp.]|uniref:group II intron maturase-specific domain-containing protein n=1 Tax=Clostridium sp. TaxID=1506 RepID=UPI003217381C